MVAMIDDIIPSKRTSTSFPPTRHTMSGLRLRGHVAGEARKRILNTIENNDKQVSKPPSAQASLMNSDELSSSRLLRLKNYTRQHKKLTIAIVLAILAIAIGVGWILLNRSPSEPTKAAQPAITAPIETPKPKTIASPLSGVQVLPELAKRPVTAVMIENSTDARPQSGLRDAGVVFEAIAEGGITRFLALYQEGQPGYLGPVRSLRPYYLDWAAPFDASIVHVGGSRDALDQVRTGMKDLDQFFNGNFFSRITERYAPHNVYTSFDRLDALNTSKGYTSSSFTSWERKKESPAASIAAKSIDLKISGPYYNVHYDYHPPSNSYFRSEGGKPHVDITSANDKAPAQLNPKTVLALVMPYNYGGSIDGIRAFYETLGSGQLVLFQDGIAYQGTWTKKDRASQFSFNDPQGNTLTLNAGQAWITMVSAANSITFKP